MMKIIKRLVRIYTPFICALIAIIHGVLVLNGYNGILYRILSEFTGHSILLILYVISTSKQMCKWYKAANCTLLSIHIINLFYYFGFIDRCSLIYVALVMNIFALLSFLIYRVSVGITKFLC